jgi:hypothetical protein
MEKIVPELHTAETLDLKVIACGSGFLPAFVVGRRTQTEEVVVDDGQYRNQPNFKK